MATFFDYREHIGVREDRVFKATLFDGEHVMAGLNSLLPGQQQPIHSHDDSDKFYFVISGRGRFTVGDDTREAGAGTLIAAPAGVPHGVHNDGEVPLALLIAIAPPPT
jgi:mannose-6-phosphate isomerase-like protein (cupin superfamily)